MKERRVAEKMKLSKIEGDWVTKSSIWCPVRDLCSRPFSFWFPRAMVLCFWFESCTCWMFLTFLLNSRHSILIHLYLRVLFYCYIYSDFGSACFFFFCSTLSCIFPRTLSLSLLLAPFCTSVRYVNFFRNFFCSYQYSIYQLSCNLYTEPDP